VGYCCLIVKTGFEGSGFWLLVGGEEGNVKVFFATRSERGELTQAGRLKCSLHQEVFMPHNASVKSLSVAYQENEKSTGIIIGGGGKLGYCVWTFNKDKNENALQCKQLLSFGCEGTTWKHATQDHRILTTSCLYLYSTTTSHHTKSRYLISLSDSRGHVCVCICESEYANQEASSRTTFQILEDLVVSSSPIVASDMQLVSCRLEDKITCQCDNKDKGEGQASNPTEEVRRLAFGVFGETSGTVSLWLLAGSSNPIQEGCQHNLSTGSLLLLSYEAHSMGANAVSFRMQRSFREQFSKKERNGEQDENFGEQEVTVSSEDRWEFIICSGGDDQAITLCKGFLCINKQVSVHVNTVDER